MEKQPANIPTRWIFLGLGLLAITLGLATWVVIRAIAPTRTDAQSLQYYGPVPNAQLVDQNGAPRSLGDMKGRVWVANFIFTRCAGTCPMMTSKMVRLQKAMHEDDLSFVTFTVDPVYDKPQVLRTYARDFGASDKRWVFLTGDEQTVRRLVIDGFKLPMQEGTDPKEPIIHSTRFVLVDARGNIRGYYDGLEGDISQKVASDARALISEG